MAEMEARLRADADLVLRLALSGYAGPDWDMVVERLAAYGLRVLTAWICDGTIQRKCQDKNWPGPWDNRCRSIEVAGDLATNTVMVALPKFRDSVLIPGRWSPNGGASLATYFIGQCLLRWANVHRDWVRWQKKQLALSPDGWVEKERSSADSTDRLLDRIQIEDLAPKGSIERQILDYQAAGFSWDEISALTGRSVPSVRGLTRRLRESSQTNGNAHEEAS